MVIDKAWMEISDRTLPQYEKGVNEFLDFAFKQLDEGRAARCPCKKCNNNLFRTRQSIYEHLMLNGISKNYKHWYNHGEGLQYYSEDDNDDDDDANQSDKSDNEYGMRHMLSDLGYAHANHVEKIDVQITNDAFVMDDNSAPNKEANDSFKGNPTSPNKDAAIFFRLLHELEQDLYPGCEESSTLSFIVEVLNWKCLYKVSANAVDKLLQIMKKWFPKGNKVPSSYNDCKKVSRDLGLSYERIDACVNDCILYWKNYENAQSCPTCGESRWENDGKMRNMTNEHDGRKNIPQKVLRYFPLTPRLQRLYMSYNIAKDMRWHKEKPCNNELMGHPVDSPAWKSFDATHPIFAADPRNIRLGLASDGFNPFGNMSSSYSVWPVVLVPYNLPPWLCMKDQHIMMSLLIPGPKAPGNDIDVYLEPLIDELQCLWESGVETYDALSKSNFQLRAALLWTINDFPAYANLSGWSTKGKLACPVCNLETSSRRLKNGHKTCYLGHRRFLPTNHSWRKNAKAFDGTKENRSAPKQLTGDDIVEQYSQFSQITFGKASKKRKRGDVLLFGNWRKKSIFFQLSYWRTLTVRHNLDVMHIEKNVCDNIIGTLLNIESKTKDTINSRFDLEDMGIRPELHATTTSDGRYMFRPACYTLSKDEKRSFCQFLNDLKVPDGYSSNISRCVILTECKVVGMKCHDCHVFLHRYLPLAIRGLLDKEVCEALIELCTYLRELCAKVLYFDDLERLEKSISFTLCKLEKIFPPSFFDIMVHLTIHLVSEAKVAGPVQFRWMYPIERYLRRLKSYVRNKARPEGSIAEAYIVQECMHFCSRYLHRTETRINRVGRNDEGRGVHSHSVLHVFSQAGRPLLGKKYDQLSLTEWDQATIYVLENCEEIREFVE
ncbi:uncharacterized protein LOC120277753 [Dioscorea cayenensis subsp. rotundata]|uniref:Uncharacterized protein LOC120277753 n=1 Tax=Dioscorea cayennensis subsp. rotundata TaxID=55577 RepID=A0AB40CL34_DIOCR|nr:uncharacterized protein LOC120277753 [Dioscorea cayenensis subsp. rotundata]